MARLNERDALQRINKSKNSISGKKIYLAATAEKSGDEEYRGVYSAGLKMWSAVDFLVNYCKYQIVYEMAGNKKKIRQE